MTEVRSPERSTGRRGKDEVWRRVSLQVLSEFVGQRQVLDVALEHERGRLAYRDVVVSVPRQAGESTLVLVLILYRLLAARCHAVYGAQTRLAARQKLLDDWLPMIRRSPLSKLFDVSRATGQEALFAPAAPVAAVG
jgi:hypothetical protein